MVNYHIGIARVTGSEHYNLKVSRKSLQNIDSMRANVYASFYLFTCGKFNLELNVVGKLKGIITMNEGFIQIKNYCFLVYLQKYVPA